MTQPNLSQTLTLQLLQQNRNPEPITFGQPRPPGASVAAAGAAQVAGRPQPANQVQTPVLGSKRPVPVNSPATNGSAAKELATPKASHQERVNIKVRDLEFEFLRLNCMFERVCPVSLRLFYHSSVWAIITDRNNLTIFSVRFYICCILVHYQSLKSL